MSIIQIWSQLHTYISEDCPHFIFSSTYLVRIKNIKNTFWTQHLSLRNTAPQLIRRVLIYEHIRVRFNLLRQLKVAHETRNATSSLKGTVRLVVFYLCSEIYLKCTDTDLCVRAFYNCLFFPILLFSFTRIHRSLMYTLHIKIYEIATFIFLVLA